MAERYIKDEDGKKVVYEKGEWGLFDRRVGEIEETSIFDFTEHSHRLKPDDLFAAPSWVDEDRNSVYSNKSGPMTVLGATLRPNDYTIHDDEGSSRYEYDGSSGRFEHAPGGATPGRAEASRADSATRDARRASADAYSTDTGSSSGTSLLRPSALKAPEVLPGLPRGTGASDSRSSVLPALALVAAGVLLLGFLASASSSPSYNRPRKPTTYLPAVICSSLLLFVGLVMILELIRK